MPTWMELDQHFRELAPAMRWTRLDYQWGAAGTYYRLAGAGGATDATRRFEALAALAGAKLDELPHGTVHGDVFAPDDPTERWYEALRHYSDAFQHERTATQHDKDGTFRGNIYSGFVQSPSYASGVVSLRLAAVPLPPPPVPAVERGAVIIHGNVGAVQTGANATAYVSLSTRDDDRLAHALRELRDALHTNQEVTPEQREQGTELVGDILTAAAAEKPNTPKIAGLLGGLATMVQTVASLRSAWELVRDAALAAGVIVGSLS